MSEDCLPRLRAHLADLEAGLGGDPAGQAGGSGQWPGGQDTALPAAPGAALRSVRFRRPTGICVSNLACAALGLGEELNLWDFGGQDIYHGNARPVHAHAGPVRHRLAPGLRAGGRRVTERDPVPQLPACYWLDYVRTLGHAQSPVIVVQSRCDNATLEARRLPADSDGIPFLKQCWHSAKTGRGQAALAEAIRDAVDYLREREGVVG